MFNNDKEKNSNKDAETIIGPSVKVKGDFNCHGSMIIEGIVEGSLKTDNDLFVGEKSTITANVIAKNAKVSGVINGDLTINGYLEITSSAKILGTIIVKSVSIEKGAIFNGQCKMTGESNAKQPE